MGAALSDPSGLRAQRAGCSLPLGDPAEWLPLGRVTVGHVNLPNLLHQGQTRRPTVTGPVLKPSRPDIEEKGGPGRQRGNRRGPE